MKVLLIDERPDTMEFLRESMINFGFNTGIAKNKGDICHMLSDGRYDLILMNGGHRELEVADYIGLQHSSLYVICLKGAPDEAGPDVGADVTLHRPFGVSRLLQTIERSLHQKPEIIDYQST